MRADDKSMVWVMATLAIALLPQIPRMPLPVMLATLAPLAWRTAAQLRGWKPLPALVRYTATGLSLVVLAVSYGGTFGRRASVSLLAAMLALKLLECEQLRDARLIVSFSFFLCATQFLFAQGVVMPIYGAATTMVGLAALVQIQRNETFGALRSTPVAADSAFIELGFALRLLAVALPVSLAFFLLFPRWMTPLWGVPETTLDAKSGLSDSMSPGTIQSLFMDDSPAFRVTFEGAVPEHSELYWRGPVFWHYDGNTWTSSFYGRNIAADRKPDETTAPWRYTVQLEPNERNWLFALDYPGLAPADTRITMDYQLLRRQPVTQLLQYNMVSNPDFVDEPELKATLRSMALELPDGSNPRTLKLINHWRETFTSDAALVERALRYFNQEAFHYSLDAPLLGDNAVDDFLFKTRSGFCEHYASAFTVMMRLAGIPARVVTGYQGGWYSAMGDYLLVRQSDAHAWSEVWLKGSGWTRVDPTAAVSPLRVEQGSLSALSAPRHVLDFDWLRGIRNGFDLVGQRWNTWVIEFNAQSQSRLFAGFGLERLGPAGLTAALMAVIALITGILLPIIFKFHGLRRTEPLEKIWSKFLRRLNRAGYTPRPSQGAMELAAEAAARMPGYSTQIFAIALLYTRRRYSSMRPELDQIRRAIANFHPKATID